MSKGNRRTQALGREENQNIAEIMTLSETQATAVERENAYDYIEAMAAELSKMANAMNDEFLGYLLGLAVEEAKSTQVGGCAGGPRRPEQRVPHMPLLMARSGRLASHGDGDRPIKQQ